MATPTEILTAGGLANADLIVQAASATGLPLAILAAMVQKESGGQNIYGRDGKDTASPGVYANDYPLQVTKENFTEFRAAVLAGQKSNGVGPSQITYPGYWKQYPDYPFWDVLANLKFGATLLMDLLDGDYSDASISSAGARYNGGTNPGEKAIAYGADLLTETNTWRARLAGASEIGGSGMDWANVEPDLYRLMNKNYTPGRAGRSIDKIVLHHNGGTLTTEQCWQVWQTREASAHYQVEVSGRIGQLVNDSDTAWHAGNQDVNQTSIGIEHANNALSPAWTVSDATLDAGAHLVAALCRYYNLGRPVWGQNVFGHKSFYATDCPGALAGTQNAAYMERANYYYDNLTGGTPSDTTTPSEEDMPTAQEIATAVWEQPVDLGLPDGTTQTEKAGLWIGWANRHALTASERAEQALAKLDEIKAQVTAQQVAAGGIDPTVLTTIQEAAQQIVQTSTASANAASALGAALANLTTK